MHIEDIKMISEGRAFRALEKRRYPFLLSRSAKKDGSVGAYSYIGSDPSLVIRTERGVTTVSGDALFEEREWQDPFEALGEISALYRREPGPFPFSGGAVGYFSYDLKELVLPIKDRAGHKNYKSEQENDFAIPDAMIGIYKTIVIIDHKEGTAHIVSSEKGEEATERIRELLDEAEATAPLEESSYEGTGRVTIAAAATSNLTREEYIERVERAKRYISDGDIYQINVTQRFRLPYSGDPFDLYQSVLRRNRAPFSSYIDFGEFQVVSNSPERLLKVDAGEATTEPIKGTRPRGASVEEDEALKRALQESEKEQAEHVMIVDLERNDIGSIAEPGSVEVEGFARIETFRGLHHMVSTVKGRLKPGIDAPAALKRIFPGGSITGTPKLRATEIIDELETIRRGLYTGAVGWMDLSGSMDMAVAIRTAVCKDKIIHLGIGSGIVADSVPSEEYDETLLKAGDFIAAIEEREGLRGARL